MKFTLPVDDFTEAVTCAARGIPANPTTPVRAGTLIWYYDGAIAFTGSDGDVTFTGHVPCSVSGDEDVTVPGKILAEVAKTFPNQDPPVDVHFDADKTMATLTCGRIQFKLPVYKDGYPALPAEAAPAGSVESGVLAEAVRRVSLSASKTGSNPALGCVRLEPDGDTLWAVCTDKYRLAAAKVAWNPDKALEPALVAPAAAERLPGGLMSIGWDDRVATFRGHGFTATSRLVEGKFPEWRRLLPEDPCTVQVITAELAGALKRAQLACAADAPVQLSFTKGYLRVEAGDGNHADDMLDASHHGEDFSALFGAKFLMDGLSGCGDAVCFGFTTPLAPVHLQSGGFSYTLLPRRPA
jgi:DNA polymerase-3 subunit beta